ESPAVLELVPGAYCRVETFGIEVAADWRAEAVTPGPRGVRFRLVRRGVDEGEFEIALPGLHNVRNALAALAAADAAGLAPSAARRAGSRYTTTSLTIRPPSGRRSARSGRRFRGAASSPCSSPAPTRPAPGCSRRPSRRP